MNIADLRMSYERDELDESASAADPMAQFGHWLEQALHAVLLAGVAKVAARYALHPPRPPHWGGYRLLPDRWEFWQGRKSRLHDRLRYRLEAGVWVRERLAP